jgi:hypothetical protein
MGLAAVALAYQQLGGNMLSIRRSVMFVIAFGLTMTVWSAAQEGSGSGPGTQALRFTLLSAPCRVVDTRLPDGLLGGPAIQGGTSRDFPLPRGSCGLPLGSTAYSLNVTVVPFATLDYLTIWPTGQPQPFISTMNSPDGRVKANAAIVLSGTGGAAVSVFVSDTANVILDIDGYFTPTNPSNLTFYPLTPCRVADTRGAVGELGGPFLAAGQERDFPVQQALSCNIPPSAQAYSLNMTAIPHSTLNFLTVWPAGGTQPNVSTLNAPTGAVTANAAIVQAGLRGVAVFPTDDTDLVIDINGYFAPAGPGGLSLYGQTPCRVLDTRAGNGPFNGTLVVDVTGSSCAVPSTAQSFVFNATVVPPVSLGYLSLWPDGEMQPFVSTLNAYDGFVTSNMAIVPTTNGSVDAFTSDSSDLILDISSYFAP